MIDWKFFVKIGRNLTERFKISIFPVYIFVNLKPSENNIANALEVLRSADIFKLVTVNIPRGIPGLDRSSHLCGNTKLEASCKSFMLHKLLFTWSVTPPKNFYHVTTIKSVTMEIGNNNEVVYILFWMPLFQWHMWTYWNSSNVTNRNNNNEWAINQQHNLFVLSCPVSEWATNQLSKYGGISVKQYFSAAQFVTVNDGLESRPFDDC